MWDFKNLIKLLYEILDQLKMLAFIKLMLNEIIVIFIQKSRQVFFPKLH